MLGQQETTRNIRPSKPLRVNKNLRSNLRAKERREVEAEADGERRKGNPPSWKHHNLKAEKMEDGKPGTSILKKLHLKELKTRPSVLKY